MKPRRTYLFNCSVPGTVKFDVSGYYSMIIFMFICMSLINLNTQLNSQ